MVEQELQEQRGQNWGVNSDPVGSLKDARSFLETVGFCLMYPERSLPLVPSFIGAYTGSASGLPDTKHAFSDPRAQQATDLMVRLLREPNAYEVNLFSDTHLIIGPRVFPY